MQNPPAIRPKPLLQILLRATPLRKLLMQPRLPPEECPKRLLLLWNLPLLKVYHLSLIHIYIDFDRFTFSTVLNNLIPLRTKKKKWKAIQIMLKSDAVNEGFGVHSVVVRYLYAGYAKR